MRPCRHLRPFITRACRVSVCVASCFSALHLAASWLLLAMTQACQRRASWHGLGRRQQKGASASRPAATGTTAIPAHSPTTARTSANAKAVPGHAMSCRGVPSFRGSLSLYRAHEALAIDSWMTIHIVLMFLSLPPSRWSAIATSEVETSLEQQVPGCLIELRQALCQSLEDSTFIGSRPGPSQ